MSNLAVIIAIGLIGGIAIGVQAPMAAIMGERVGPLESVLFVHLSGAIVVGVLLLFFAGGKLDQWNQVPWWAWLSGTMGVITVSTTIFMVPKIGVGSAIVLIIAGQLLIASVIDHFGWLGVDNTPITWQRTMGMALVLLGAWFAVRGAE